MEVKAPVVQPDKVPKIPNLARVKNIIAIASGKGGVGKSTTAVNIAYALNELNYKVGLMDADIYGPSIPTMTKPNNPDKQRDNLIVPPEKDGVKIISISMFVMDRTANILRGPMVASVVNQLLTQTDWGELDYLIIDYPPGTGDVQLTLSQLIQVSGAIIVTTPQLVSAIDVEKAIYLFQKLNVPVVGIIETMSYFTCDKCDTKHLIFKGNGGEKLAVNFGLPLLGKIPINPKIAENSDAGTPFVLTNKESKEAEAFKQSTLSLVQEVEILNSKDTGLKDFHLDWK